MRHRHAARDLTTLAAALLSLAALTVMFRALPGMSPTTVALGLLLAVLAAATISRLWVAIVVAVVATVMLNFFFLPPVGALTIADPQNWVALFAFLIVAVISSNLSAAAQARARDAVARRLEVTRLFDLSRDVLLTTETAGALDALARHVARRFELTDVAICLPQDGGWHLYQGGEHAIEVAPSDLDAVLTRARGTLEFDARERAYGGHVTISGPLGEVKLVPLRQGVKAIGVLAATAPALDVGALDAVAGVAAIAIERAQFLAERDAAELVRQKADLAGTLLASLSHDLRTPLTAIRVAVENLGRSKVSDSERVEQTRVALSELDRLTRLFQDILDMARVEAGAISINKQWISAADLVDAAAAHVRHALEGHVLRVEAQTDAVVEIDPALTSAALAHLLENAAQYSPPDRAITVRADLTTSGLHVSVEDGGPGLDPSELDHLFERFYRGRTARQASFGTGMGLAITRGLLAAAGGQVWAENLPGGGARFSMVVPGAIRPASVAS